MLFVHLSSHPYNWRLLSKCYVPGPYEGPSSRSDWHMPCCGGTHLAIWQTTMCPRSITINHWFQPWKCWWWSMSALSVQCHRVRVDNRPQEAPGGTYSGFGARQIRVQIPLSTHRTWELLGKLPTTLHLSFFQSTKEYTNLHFTGLLQELKG